MDSIEEIKKTKADLENKMNGIRQLYQKSKSQFDKLSDIKERIDAEQNSEGIVNAERMGDNSIRIVFKTEADQKKFFDENFK